MGEGWSMWSYTMASGGENAADRSMKAMSWEVNDVVVFAIGGDAVAVVIESDLMGSICSCDIMSGVNDSVTISIISIMIIIVANIIISIVIVMIQRLVTSEILVLGRLR